MEKNTKLSFKVYSAWNYQKEIEDLNKASEQGWQLVKGGCFHSRFVKNPASRYRYQLDYRKIEDGGRYIETFREQGWEYVNSTFNGWHYFRKLYDPTLPDEAYEIFTDRESLQEMNRRWARLATVIGTVVGLFALVWLVRMIRQPNLPVLIQLLLFAVESVILLRGATIMRNPEASRNRRGDSALLAVFLAVILLGSAAIITLTLQRPYPQTSQIAGSVDAPIVDNRWADFEVRYPDYYYLDLSFDSPAPFTFAIVREDGEVVFTETGTSFRGENIRLPLSRGNYCFSMSCEDGFSVNCYLH